jgi:hypothetical protein
MRTCPKFLSSRLKDSPLQVGHFSALFDPTMRRPLVLNTHGSYISDHVSAHGTPAVSLSRLRSIAALASQAVSSVTGIFHTRCMPLCIAGLPSFSLVS